MATGPSGHRGAIVRSRVVAVRKGGSGRAVIPSRSTTVAPALGLVKKPMSATHNDALVLLEFIQSFIHSLKDLYSTSSRKLLRGAPDSVLLLVKLLLVKLHDVHKI